MTQESTFQNLTLNNDFLFKRVMQKKRICKHFLEELLQTKIADITYQQTEQTLDVYYDSHGIRLDVKVADATNTHYNIEMQVKNTVNSVTKEPLLPKRTRYYQAMLDVDNLQKGQDYDELPTTYIIFVCPFDFLEDSQRIYTFKKFCVENKKIELKDEATVLFLNTTGTKGNISKDIQSLYDYINSNVITSDFTKVVDETVVEIKNDKKVRKEFMTYEMRMKDLRNESLAEGRAEGKAEGIGIYAALTKKLLSLGRISDIEKAADDEAFRNKLLKEFAIQ